MSALVDVDEVIADVAKEAGLSNYGDWTFRDGLEVFVSSLSEEAGLTEIGQMAAVGQIRHALTTRLLVEDWIARHPAVDDERIEKPIFIVGMSRSGTTALSHLLARDPANRSLLGWEAAAPVPPPQPQTYTTDPRFEAAKADEFGMLHQMNPELVKMHHDPPDMPVECLVPMTPHFVTLSLSLVFPVPSYTRWVIGADHEPVYRWHEKVLRLLQSGGVRGRWQLKSPQHAIGIEALAAQYPDARFIVTHRDPSTCVASTADMARAFGNTFAHERPGSDYGPLWADLLVAMGDAMLAFRAKHGDERFVDVPYRGLTSEPVEMVQRIYEALGEQVSEQALAAMRAHVGTAVQNRFGKHAYGWEDLGLNRAELDERFGAYRDQYAEYLG
ncbi:MAG TPA: sulfotransferase [Frankiaceae bacterium]|nr:sulfotransferase [Frankiaceae bacterium]